MVAPLTVRILQLLCAAALAACAGSPTVATSEPTTLILSSRNSPTLALQNASANAPDEPNSSVRINKVINDEGMQALIATYESQKLFERTLSRVPSNARQALVLQRGDMTAAWVFSPNTQDPNSIAFIQARTFFLQLFNHARSYSQAPEGAAADLKDSARRAQNIQSSGAIKRQP